MTDDLAPRCADCGSALPVVGLGDPPEPLCLACFEKAMEALGRKLRRFREARMN